MQRIRVGFLGYNDTWWMGGINYLKNLLYAVSKLEHQKIEPYIFFEKNADPSVVKMFEENANCVFLTYNTPIAFLNKAFTRLTGRNHFLNYYFKKYRIDVISHSRFNSKGVKAKIIDWIPDFQHLHLPELFSNEELGIRNVNFRKRIMESDRIVVSSNDALKDCISFESSSVGKVRVLNFVSQVDKEIYQVDLEIRKKILEKFRLPDKFFYLPNQFWKHKNHTVVFKAIALMKQQGIKVILVCTGNFQALENKEYIYSLQHLIKELQIEDSVILPGVVSYSEVQFLMRYSVSVINPSYFEGWSSTVEECKSMGKSLIISDIPVHKEQNPAETLYFNPDDEKDLAEKMKQKWNSYSGTPDFNLELFAKEKLRERTIDFGKKYESIVLELFNKS